MGKTKLISAAFGASLVVAVLTPYAAAYLDPGSWSYVFQLLIAGVLGGLFSIGVYWSKLKAYVGGLFRGSKSDPKQDE